MQQRPKATRNIRLSTPCRMGDEEPRRHTQENMKCRVLPRMVVRWPFIREMSDSVSEDFEDRGLFQMARRKRLGDFGEIVAKEIIANLGYTNVEMMPPNTPIFDLQADYDNERYIFSVKTRNKWRHNGDLKIDDYNLYADKGKAEDTRKKLGVQLKNLMWVAVTVDIKTKTYCAYLGNVNQLTTMKYIPMKPQDIDSHISSGRCIASDEYDSRISSTWSNIQ